MRRVTSGSRAWGRRGAVAGLAGLALALAGCTGGEDTSSANPAAVTINSPAQIAQESADDYNDNVNGLITGQTLQHWIDDWENNKPAGVNGRLVILQVSAGPGGSEYITPNEAEGVFTYRVPDDRWTQTRSNGVIETVSMVPEGAQVDTFLRDYNIDPNNDMVVCAMGTGSAGFTMRQGRCWYMFRYWGARKENLAVLNGGASHPAVMDASYLGSTATCDEVEDGDACLPRNGRVSVRDLPEDNISLQATLEDVIAMAEGRRGNVFLWDARSPGEYLGTAMNSNRSMQGHPNGAVLLPYLNLLVDDDGSFRYKDKATLAEFMTGALVDGAEFEGYDSGALIPLGVGNAYQPGQTVITYCETTFRAMVTGFATAAILGHPMQFYDGATREWNHLSAGVQNNAWSFNLPADSPWRTDLVTRSVFNYNTPLAFNPGPIDDPYGADTRAITRADRAYRLGLAPGAGDGNGGVAPPANPCGG